MEQGTLLQAKEVKAIVISILFLVLGFAIVWLAKTLVGIQTDAVYITLLFIPVLVYFIISGRLKEFKGPGGLEARFSEAAAQSIKPTSETIEPSIEDIQIIAKEGVRAIQRQQAMIDDTRPIVMTMVLRARYSYDWTAVRQYIRVLSQHRNFRFVVFLDEKERFVAYMSAGAFNELTSLPELGDEFISVVNDNRIQDLYRYPGVVRDTISTKSTDIEALQEMTKQNLEALVVIDENRQLKGVIEREQVIGKIILTLVQ